MNAQDMREAGHAIEVFELPLVRSLVHNIIITV